ncbi:MAG: glycosyltransferase family 2 protein [Vampirovibrionia bacterium]
MSAIDTSNLPITNTTAKSEIRPDISIVIPIYNEVENVPLLAGAILEVMDNYGSSYEAIFIDDGSTDGTSDILKQLSEEHKSLKTIKFRKNFGQTAAMAAGFDMAKGDVIIAMDGDLQNDPKDIPKLIAKLNEGYDVVNGWRKNRQDAFINRKLPSMIANWLIGRVTGVKLHDYGCSLKAYKAETIKMVSLYGEMHRFIPALASIEGAEITEMEVNHHARQFGQSKYNIMRTFKVILDLMTVTFLKKFATRPLHMFGRAGFIAFFLGFCSCAYLTIDKILFGHSIGDRPLLLLGILLILTGIQLISTGIIAELQIRTYFESQHKPIYRIKEIYE